MAGRPKQTGRDTTPRPSPRALSLISDQDASARPPKAEGGERMCRSLVLLVLGVSLVLSAGAIAQSPPVMVLGHGLKSCGAWTSARREHSYLEVVQEAWVA